jgi:hypothetical protein
MTAKDRTIEAILEIELQMFLTVNPEPTSGCQEHPESFKLHRRAQFAPWSEEALGSYLEDLHAGGARNAFRAHPGTSPPGPAGDKAPGGKPVGKGLRLPCAGKGLRVAQGYRNEVASSAILLMMRSELELASYQEKMLQRLFQAIVFLIAVHLL